MPQPSAMIERGVLHLERHAAGAVVTVTRGRPAVDSTRWNVSRRGWSAPWLPTHPGTSAAARSEAGRERREGGFPRHLPKCAVGREGTASWLSGQQKGTANRAQNASAVD